MGKVYDVLYEQEHVMIIRRELGGGGGGDKKKQANKQVEII